MSKCRASAKHTKGTLFYIGDTESRRTVVENSGLSDVSTLKRMFWQFGSMKELSRQCRNASQENYFFFGCLECLTTNVLKNPKSAQPRHDSSYATVRSRNSPCNRCPVFALFLHRTQTSNNNYCSLALLVGDTTATCSCLLFLLNFTPRYKSLTALCMAPLRFN